MHDNKTYEKQISYLYIYVAQCRPRRCTCWSNAHRLDRTSPFYYYSNAGMKISNRLTHTHRPAWQVGRLGSSHGEAVPDIQLLALTQESNI
eukprot:2673425-Amphidinium_carterae.4